MFSAALPKSLLPLAGGEGGRQAGRGCYSLVLTLSKSLMALPVGVQGVSCFFTWGAPQRVEPMLWCATCTG